MKIKSPPLASNGLEIYKSKITCKHIHKNSLGYIVCFANDFLHSNTTQFLSSQYGPGTGISVFKKHFQDWCMIYTIRKSTKSMWYNNQFPYYEPKIKRINKI